MLQETSLASPSLVRHLAESKHKLVCIREWLLEGIVDEVEHVSKTKVACIAFGNRAFRTSLKVLFHVGGIVSIKADYSVEVNLV